MIRTGLHDGKACLSTVKHCTACVRPAGGEAAYGSPGMRHGMGLFTLEDESVCSAYRLYGHQGFAYGAVNGFFFDEEGNGFVSFNSGASERRAGRLSCLNRDLIRMLL